MTTIYPINKITQEDIERKWDDIAEIRKNQIENEKDLSFKYITKPCIFELAKESDSSYVVDVGCGIGILTNEFSKKTKKTVGIDISGKSIKIARELFGKNAKVEFIHSTVENYSKNVTQEKFTLAIANMTLMDVLNLDEVLRSIAIILKPKAKLIFTITHPCFWPIYSGYASQNWFNYKKEIKIMAPFKISLDDSCNIYAYHAHRPLEQYVQSLLKAGFVIEQVREPMPSKEIENIYPEIWKYPRFMGISCVLEK